MTEAPGRTYRDWPLLVLQTAVAAVLSLVVNLVMFVIVRIVVYVINSMFNDFNPAWADFWAQCVAAYMSVALARLACDAVLKHYSSKAICVIFCALALLAGVGAVFYMPLGWKTLSDVIVLGVICVSSVAVFWKRVDFHS